MSEAYQERRQYQRCYRETHMVCSHLNQADHHPVAVKNFSEFGSYFESRKAFKPGAIVVLRGLAGAAHQGASRAVPMPLPAANPPDSPAETSMPAACMNGRFLAVAQIRRCHKLNDELQDERYGVGVYYIHLAE